VDVRGYGVPHWTGFTIGYHIIKDYRSRHPHVSWAALTSASATLAQPRHRGTISVASAG
jgi:uncharacterized protein YjaZ